MNLFKKLLLTVVVLLFSINASYGENYKKISNDSKILDAINVLEKTNNEKTLNLIRKKKHLKIIFYDLTLISFDYVNHYALASSDGFDTDYVLINLKYKKAPVEAISSLIAHEMTHQQEKTTMEEEIRAWTNEAKQWIECKKQNPKLASYDEKNYPLIKRLNKLEKLYIKANKKSTLIAELVRSNSTYRKLALK